MKSSIIGIEFFSKRGRGEQEDPLKEGPFLLHRCYFLFSREDAPDFLNVCLAIGSPARDVTPGHRDDAPALIISDRVGMTANLLGYLSRSHFHSPVSFR